MTQRNSRFYTAQNRIEEIKKLKSQGLDNEDIAERLGINKNSISDAIRRHEQKGINQ